MVEIDPGHYYYWIIKQSGHDHFHDYYWILRQDMIRIFNGQDMISQVNIYVMDIVWILCDFFGAVWRKYGK